jgi:hypothetical protein
MTLNVWLCEVCRVYWMIFGKLPSVVGQQDA